MKRALGWLVLVLLVVVAGAGFYVYRNVHAMDVHELSEDLHVIMGLGSNVGVLKTQAGAVVVDTMTMASQGRKIRARVEELTGGKAVAIINTHYHLDHTHGNPGFEPGTQVIATARTLQHLHDRDGDYWKGDAASLLPGRTFEKEELLDIGGKKIRCLHLGRGHTDGDLVVIFEDERVMHTGDLFFHNYFPNIDLEAGGSIKEWIATIDRLLELDVDRIIPGHGPVTDKEGLRKFQRFLVELWEVGTAAARDGKTLEETVRSTRLKTAAGMEDIYVPFLIRLDHDFVVRRAWEEATGTVRATAAAASGARSGEAVAR
ncbi:MAG TPA: MBL fold metallo-hydrolase [Candidatus Limnocylindrales bacterium]|nr:MBL fold metallo-hydrolase [Candidatus Limnocylindrales bacterium]